jgi:hypothetical protein
VLRKSRQCLSGRQARAARASNAAISVEKPLVPAKKPATARRGRGNYGIANWRNQSSSIPPNILTTRVFILT